MTPDDSDVSVVWFDDEQDREPLAEALRDNTGFRVHFVNLEKKNVLVWGGEKPEFPGKK